MNKERKLIIAGNWKMNKTVAEACDLVTDLKRDLAHLTSVDMVVCPPFTALADVSKILQGTPIWLGAQNVSEYSYGAYTGEIAPGHLRELLVHYVILGHSERRQFQRETDELVAKKAKSAHQASLIPIVCVGETLAERESDRTEEVVGTQIKGSLSGLTNEEMQETIVAYEPVWAIGTGKTATSQQAQDVHAFIRRQIAAQFGETIAKCVRIQYGGSVKPANANELMSQKDVDGALVGGASLDANNFVEIIKNTV
ncbi:MAG: triose-phosphate isomerase [Pedosphaera sp.]|nr:triose-phosphate isomerase [Pedosphaera sp.]